jgi:hypothetical protein
VPFRARLALKFATSAYVTANFFSHNNSIYLKNAEFDADLENTGLITFAHSTKI